MKKGTDSLQFSLMATNSGGERLALDSLLGQDLISPSTHSVRSGFRQQAPAPLRGCSRLLIASSSNLSLSPPLR